MVKVTISRISAATLSALVLIGGVSPAASAAPAASVGLYPAPGVYEASPSGVVLPTGGNTIRETVLATIVSLSGFEVVIQITNVSGGTLSVGCHLPSRLKTASDSHLLYGKITERGYDSTCSEDPSFSPALGPGESTQSFVVFYNPPPPLGTQVRFSSVFSGSHGSAKTYYTRPFDPYGAGTSLRVTTMPPPSGEGLAQVLQDGYDLTTNILDLLGLVHLELLDIDLLSPWITCGDNTTCLEQLLPTPYLPTVFTT